MQGRFFFVFLRISWWCFPSLNVCWWNYSLGIFWPFSPVKKSVFLAKTKFNALNFDPKPMIGIYLTIALTIKGQNIGASTKNFCKQMFDRWLRSSLAKVIVGSRLFEYEICSNYLFWFRYTYWIVWNENMSFGLFKSHA